MSSKKHGISIGMERIGTEVYLSFKVMGKLSHEDYEFITPMLESALAGVKQPSITALVDCTEFDGWELRALWDDFKLGLRYSGKITKAAVLGHSSWMERMTKVGNWFTSAEIRYFEDETKALEWLK